MKEPRLTGAKTGEKPGNFQCFGKYDPVIADRAYGTIAGMEYPGGCGSDFIPRYRTGVFNLYSGERERVEVTDFFQGLEAGVRGGVNLYYKVREAYKPIGKTEEAELKGIERLEEMNRVKSHGKPPGEARLTDNRYVIAAASPLEAGACLIPQVYRFRRRIEPVFKRLKSLFGYNQIPSKADISAKARFYGKLFPETGEIRLPVFFAPRKVNYLCPNPLFGTVCRMPSAVPMNNSLARVSNKIYAAGDGTDITPSWFFIQEGNQGQRI